MAESTSDVIRLRTPTLDSAVRLECWIIGRLITMLPSYGRAVCVAATDVAGQSPLTLRHLRT